MAFVAEIHKGDLIDGLEVTEIIDDPFISNQVDIFLDAYEKDDFGDETQKCIRVRRLK